MTLQSPTLALYMRCSSSNVRTSSTTAASGVSTGDPVCERRGAEGGLHVGGGIQDDAAGGGKNPCRAPNPQAWFPAKSCSSGWARSTPGRARNRSAPGSAEACASDLGQTSSHPAQGAPASSRTRRSRGDAGADEG
eukprot:CAMPEP_0170370220 /NCGR_PEP_ID=MMETSP0117_2-20130122/8399_1 /TAXON_ID=400756 /ORGANISM="Durinskia baltica, Strain CSIRO CS-38" /LENGTH=135 /DNA_ID=CAMNT_0010624989 /DNA_START=194 /DNA_END=600 /DNA_ORIENTATION=-